MVMDDLPESSADRRLRLIETEVKQLKDKVDLLENIRNEHNMGELIMEDASTLSLVDVTGDSSVEAPDDSASAKKREKRKRRKKNKRGAGNDGTAGRHAVFTKILVGLIPTALLFSLALGQGGVNIIGGSHSSLLSQEESGPTKAASIREYLKKMTKVEDEEIVAVQTRPSLRSNSKQRSPKAIEHERLLQESSTQPLNPTIIPSTSSSLPPDSSRPSVIPSNPSRPLMSSSSLIQCPIADNTVCGCEVVAQSDYRGMINESVEGPTCARWDSDWITAAFGSYLPQSFPDAGLIENFCRNPQALNERAGCISSLVSEDGGNIHFCDVPMCDPCSCMPQCGQPNLALCGCPSYRQADECCDDVEDVDSCKCGYLRDACSKSLQSGSVDFCDHAEEVCCKESKNPDCGCNMLEQICSENPSQSICDFAADRCCPIWPEELHLDFPWGAEEVCKCEFFTYATNVLGFESDSQFLHCANATLVQIQLESRRSLERGKLERLYTDTGGQYWFNNEGWKDENDLEHCNWYGVTCNDQNYLTEIYLRNNNLTGHTCWACRIDFEDLIKLDLAQNQISMEKSSRLLYNRKLEYIDMSENVMTGHVDVLIFPAATLVNFSHNQFASAGFKRFREAYDTLRVVDMSSNYISQDASEIFLNIPPTLETVDFSNNDIGGFIPEKFPIERVQFFAMSNNSISGPLPDFPNTSPKLRSLILRDNGLTGPIPDDIFKLADLSVLDLASNNLTQSIPPSIGDLSQLNFLNLSSNEFSQSVPIKFVKLKGRCCNYCPFFLNEHPVRDKN